MTKECKGVAGATWFLQDLTRKSAKPISTSNKD